MRNALQEKSRRGLCAVLLVCLCLLWGQAAGAEPAAKWYWLSSDDKYSKFFDPDSVRVTHRTQTARGEVPTGIQAMTKTGYSYAGAKETVESYGIQAVVNPSQLAYSLARVEISPQSRTIQYVQEDFYNQQGAVIWSTTSGTLKEVNSQEFNEAFYDAIVDEVFRQGEVKRAAASDRWIKLWEDTTPESVKTQVSADTTTMRMKGGNLIYWGWEEVSDGSGKVLEIKFVKKAVDLAQGRERVVNARYWSTRTGWQNMEDSFEGAYRTIAPQAPEYKGLERLRAFAKGYSTWVNRYTLE